VKIPNLMARVPLAPKGRVPPVPNPTPAALEALRGIFATQGLTTGQPAASASGADMPDVLTSLFMHGLALESDLARQSLNPAAVDLLVGSGLLEVNQGQVRARFQVQQYHDLFFFLDFIQWESDPDFVLPVGPAGKYLALLTIRRPSTRTLDLGCGCGLQALLAARHSKQVIATDINPRALALTRLNAGMNSLENIETRLGSYFEPVRSESFDLILANLPYVISPEKRRRYRTADRASLQTWPKQLARHLNPGGFAQLLLNWVHGTDQDWSEPIRCALENSPVDACLIYNGSKRPAAYADLWLKLLARNDPQAAQKTRQKWLRWYRSQHIELLALGALTLRRRADAPGWFTSEEVNRTLESPAGEQLLRLFAGQAYAI
jgi:SAM-dependent methyltransferase